MQLHIKYLRSMEDSEITRMACLKYMRDNLIYFFPERSHIVRQANELATELGEPLGAPGLSWKYSWIETLFGWMVVKPVQHSLRRARWRLAKQSDYFLYQLDRRKMMARAETDEEEEITNADLGALSVKESVHCD